MDVRKVLAQVQEGTLTVDDALLELKQKPFEDLGFAKVDLHRQIRQGAAEVIYGAGKTAEQILAIATTLRDAHQGCILITRLDEDKAPRDCQAVVLYLSCRSAHWTCW